LILLDVYFDRRQYLGFFDSLMRILKCIQISVYGTYVVLEKNDFS